jgi:hypothetical protein
MLVTIVLFLTAEELQALKEEFNHHQEKIDQYYSLLRDVEEGPNDAHQSKLTCCKESKDHYLYLNICLIFEVGQQEIGHAAQRSSKT